MISPLGLVYFLQLMYHKINFLFKLRRGNRLLRLLFLLLLGGVLLFLEKKVLDLLELAINDEFVLFENVIFECGLELFDFIIDQSLD